MKQNVIFATIGKCASSWVCGILSEVHKQMYGEKLHWNWGISRYMAITDKYYFPEGYNVVLYVNPLHLLNREYDKIVVLQRDLESILVSMQEYRFPELTYKETEEQHPDFFERIEFYYNICYDHDFDDSRIHLVQLSDLNNYTIATFSELFDFLGYPNHNYKDIIKYIEDGIKNDTIDRYEILKYLKQNPLRVPIIPINPILRNWEVSSTMLKRGHRINPLIKKIQDKSEGNYIERKEINKDKQKESTQYVNDPTLPNPYFLCPEEYVIQKGKGFRIFREPMKDTLIELGLLEDERRIQI